MFAMPDKPIKLIPTDLDAARGARIKEARSKEGRNERHQPDFPAYRDGAGRVVDFHALRHTYISRLVANAPASHILSFRGKIGSRKGVEGNSRNPWTKSPIVRLCQRESLVRPARFELATFGFEVRDSIH